MKKIQLGGHNKSKGKKIIKGWALVDDADYDWLNQWKWGVDTNGYANRVEKIQLRQKNILMHRVIMDTPKGMDTDHINGNKRDNQRKNLRICTRSQNQMNRKKGKDNTSGAMGVSWHKRDKVWRSSIKLNDKQFHLGTFGNKGGAIKARKEAEKKYFGEYARLQVTV